MKNTKKDLDPRERIPLTGGMAEGSVTMTTNDSQTTSLSHSASDSSHSFCPRFVSFWKRVYSWVSSILGLIFLLVVYSVIGAFVFRAIEAPHEKQQKKNIIEDRRDMIELLVNLTKAAPLELNATQLAETVGERLTGYELTIYEAYKNGITTLSTEPKWTFWSALFYSGTIYTTIGYGNISPATDLGRVITIIYAAIGIPLALITLADLGKRFTIGLKFVWAFVRQIYLLKCCNRVRGRLGKHDGVDAEEAPVKVANGTEVRPGVRVYFGYEISTEFNIPISVTAFVCCSYVFIGAAMYSLWEDWNYLEAVYFVFVSISTIGFGDVMPAHPKFFILSSVYVFIGLSLVSMCINVAIQFFNQQIDKAKVNLERARELAREKAFEKIHDVRGTLHKARDKMHDIGKKKSLEEVDNRSPKSHSKSEKNHSNKVVHHSETNGSQV